MQLVLFWFGKYPINSLESEKFKYDTDNKKYVVDQSEFPIGSNWVYEKMFGSGQWFVLYNPGVPSHGDGTARIPQGPGGRNDVPGRHRLWPQICWTKLEAH